MGYSDYKHLIGIPYVSGQNDCYGLAIAYYRDAFGLALTDFARPERWWDQPDLNLLEEELFKDGWVNKGINLRNLRIGDGLIMTLISGRMNHIGVYVGNGLFIHHIFGRFSVEEPLVDKWTSRILMVVRHPEVVKYQEARREVLKFDSLKRG